MMDYFGLLVAQQNFTHYSSHRNEEEFYRFYASAPLFSDEARNICAEQTAWLVVLQTKSKANIYSISGCI